MSEIYEQMQIAGTEAPVETKSADTAKTEEVESFEVFTPYEIVCDMLNLQDKHFSENGIQVPEETMIKDIRVNNEFIQFECPTKKLTKSLDKYIDAPILEPACGDGQILVEILKRKLDAIDLNTDEEKRKQYILRALASIHGIDIMNRNIIKARQRMKNIAMGKLETSFNLPSNSIKSSYIYANLGLSDEEYLSIGEAIDFILEHNIKRGNSMYGTTEDKPFEDAELNRPAIVYEYKFDFDGDKIKLIGSYLGLDETIETIEKHLSEFGMEKPKKKVVAKTAQMNTKDFGKTLMTKSQQAVRQAKGEIEKIIVDYITKLQK